MVFGIFWKKPEKSGKTVFLWLPWVCLGCALVNVLGCPGGAAAPAAAPAAVPAAAPAAAPAAVPAAVPAAAPAACL